MSTEINIKKRIDIQEEGVSITPDVNSINFTGDGVTASAIGDDVTVNIPGGMGTTTYYLNESVTQAPYKEFTSTLTASPEQTIVTSIASGATVTIQSFQTPSGVPGTTNIPGGRWAFYLHFSGTTGDSWDVFAEVYKRDLGGIETLLLTTDAVPTSTLTGTAVMLLSDGVFPTSTVLTTDRIVVKVRVTNTDSTTNSITFHTEGNTNYSIGTTTLNQVVPTGAVTSVTGTAPIASSGGATPAISISQSGAASDGYLSSTDWNTFNNKVDDNIYTADGTLTGDRTVNLNNNDLTFTDGGAATARFQVNIDDGTNAVVIDAANSFGVSLTASSSGGSGSVNVSTSGVNINGLYNLPQISGSTGQVLTRTSGSNTTWASAAGGLTYFTEAQNTAAPNATVPVDSLTAVSAATNADFAIRPKGNGAILAAIPDNTTTGGNKRGTNAIDLQTTRTNADQVASGNNSIVIGSNSKASSANGVAIGVGAVSTAAGIALQSNGSITGGAATASGTGSFAVNGGQATNLWSFAMGRSTASGVCSFAFGGYFSGNTASGDYGSLAIGEGNTAQGQSSVALGTASAATGAVSAAIGQSNTASGANAAAIGRSNIASAGDTVSIGTLNSNSGYGSQVLGFQMTVSGTYATGIGNGSTVGGLRAISFGYANAANGESSVNIGNVNTTSAQASRAFGQANTASAIHSTAIGSGNTASGEYSLALGASSSTHGIYGRQTYASGQEGALGDAQASKFILRERTTDVTATTLTTNSSAATTTNQVILQNNNTLGFTGVIVGKQSGSTNSCMWKVTGLIARGANAASTTLTFSSVELVSNAPGWGTPTLTADTTNGGLQVQVTGLGATNIQWTASIETTEVIYA